MNILSIQRQLPPSYPQSIRLPMDYKIDISPFYCKTDDDTYTLVDLYKNEQFVTHTTYPRADPIYLREGVKKSPTFEEMMERILREMEEESNIKLPDDIQRINRDELRTEKEEEREEMIENIGGVGIDDLVDLVDIPVD